METLLNNPLILLAAILSLGSIAEWIGWKLKFPPLILFLTLGIVAGPITNIINTEAILGKYLIPFVSLCVAVILFEGGLKLKFENLKDFGKPILLLNTVGALVYWIVIAAGCEKFLGLSPNVSYLMAGILVVSGPTVVIPLLKHIRLKESIASILKWEAIVIDPLGAIIAILTYQAIIASYNLNNTGLVIFFGLLKILILGITFSAVAAFSLMYLIKKDLIPEYLHTSVTLMFVILAFAIPEAIMESSGLLSASIMGVILANQKQANIKGIIQFKEELIVLLIPYLFIILAARINIDSLMKINISGFLFLLYLVFVARPISVFLSTFGTKLTIKEKCFISFFAPRGIVAAAVASIFSLHLTNLNEPNIDTIVPITFLVIIFTVVIYGLGAGPLSKLLGLSEGTPSKILIAGCHYWAQDIAEELNSEDIETTLIDTNIENILDAKLKGLDAYNVSILSDQVDDLININQYSSFLALTNNDEVNSLASIRYGELLGINNAYQLPVKKVNTSLKEMVSEDLKSKKLFGDKISYEYLNKRFTTGAKIKKSYLTEEFTFEDFKKMNGVNAIVLFIISESGKLLIPSTQNKLTPKKDQTVFCLID